MGNVNYVQMHIGDFLTGVIHMDAVETGAYIMLIMAHYQAGKKGLPDDDKKLARIAKVGAKKWMSIKDTVMEKFELSNSFWTQKRIVNELQRVKDKSSSQSAKALKRHSSPPATAQPQQCQPITNNQEPIKEVKEKIFKGNELDEKAKEFLKAYPRSGDDIPTKQTFINRVMFKGADPDQMINAAKNFASKESETEERYITKAVRWLENSGYLDEDLQAEPSKPLELGEIQEELRPIVEKIGAVKFKGWFGDSRLEGTKLIVPDQKKASRIREHYASQFRGIFKEVEVGV